LLSRLPLWLDGLNAVAWRLSAAGLASLAIYAIAVVGSVFPPRLLAPDWQIRLTTSLINNSGFAIVGLCLVHLSAGLATLQPQLRLRRDRLATWAVLAAFGFLLLIPLQIQAVRTAHSQNANALAREQRRSEQRLTAIREAISSATTAPDLRDRLRILQGPVLNDNDLARPLPELRRQLLDALTLADQARQRNFSERQGPPVDLLVKDSIKTALSCLALALGFAALSQWPGSALPLLLVWQDLLVRGRFRRQRS
jgi:hypothetical protein